MAVRGVGSGCRGGRKRCGCTFKSRTLVCHACTAQTQVSYQHPDEIASKVAERGWSVDGGAVSCPAHAAVRVLPRHGVGSVAAGGGETRMAVRY